MHLAVIRIDDIVKVDGLPSHASGRATFTNGRTCAFDASFAHGHAGARIFVRPPADGKAMDPTTRTAQAIHDRPGFTGIARRERDAIAAFEYERVTACQQRMRPGWIREPWGERIDIGALWISAADRDMDIHCQARLHCSSIWRIDTCAPSSVPVSTRRPRKRPPPCSPRSASPSPTPSA